MRRSSLSLLTGSLATLVLTGCSSGPQQKPRILSSTAPTGAPAAPPLNSTAAVEVPTAPPASVPPAAAFPVQAVQPMPAYPQPAPAGNYPPLPGSAVPVPGSPVPVPVPPQAVPPGAPADYPQNYQQQSYGDRGPISPPAPPANGPGY